MKLGRAMRKLQAVSAFGGGGGRRRNSIDNGVMLSPSPERKLRNVPSPERKPRNVPVEQNPHQKAKEAMPKAAPREEDEEDGRMTQRPFRPLSLDGPASVLNRQTSQVLRESNARAMPLTAREKRSTQSSRGRALLVSAADVAMTRAAEMIEDLEEAPQNSRRPPT